MDMTPEQAREYLKEQVIAARRIQKELREDGRKAPADPWEKEADSIDRALARIAELEALKRAMADSEGADRDSCANDRRSARANRETTDGSVKAT